MSLAYYKMIAQSKVPDKDDLRQWAEDTQPTQAQLRERIKELRGVNRYQGPGSNFLSGAWACYERWPEIFTTSSKSLPFNKYKQIAQSKVPDKDTISRTPFI